MKTCPTCGRPMSDTGTMGVSIEPDPDNPGEVMVAFEAPIASFSVTPEHARELAATLVQVAEEIEARRS